MMHRPWDCAQPDEWLPQSLRLCWGGDSDGGSSSGSSDGGSGATTGGGDWGSSGAYDASSMGSGMDYAAAFAASPGGFYDTGGPGIAEGAIGAEVGGTFGLSGMSGQPGTSAFGAELDAGGGGTSGIGNAIASWGQSTAAGGPGAGTNAAYALSGGMVGEPGGGGVFGDYGSGGGGYGGGGGVFGGYGGGGGGGGYTGGGGRGSVTDSTPGYTGSVSGGRDVTGSAVSSPYADDTGPTGRGEQDTVAPAASEAAPEASPETGPSDFGTPATSEAPEAEAAPSLSDGAPAGMIGGSKDAAPAAAPTAAPSAFGPQALDQQSLGEQGRGEDLASQLGYENIGATQGIDPGSEQYGTEAYAPGGIEPGAEQSGVTGQADLASQLGYESIGGPEAETAAPNLDQVFVDFGITPGWNPAEQTAGVTGLAEPTAWAANPYAPSTNVSVGRDFDQAFDPFGDTPTGMDLAADQRSADRGPTLDEMWGATPYSTLPSDQLSRSAQETLLHDFGFFPNPGFVQGPQQQTFSDRFNDFMNAVINPVAAVTMQPFTKGLDALMAIPDPFANVANPFANVANPFANVANPLDAFSNSVRDSLLGGSNIQSLNPDAFNTFEVGEQGRAGENPDTTPWGDVFAGAPTEETAPAIEAFIPGGRETNFDPTAAEIQSAQQTAPIDVEVVPSTDPSVPADPRGPSTSLPPAVEAPPQAAPEAPPEAPPETAPEAPPEVPQALPQEVPPVAPPSLVEMVTAPPSAPAFPGTPTTPTTPTTPAYAPQPVQPTGTPEVPPAPPAAPPVEHDDVPEPPDTSQPPQDPNAPRPPENIPGQLIGSRGTYENERADNPRTNRNYLDSGRLDNPQGEPGITFRTARQAGVEPLFRIGDIDVGNVSARLVENVNRALRAMEQRTGIPANSLVATSGQRFAHRGAAIIHGADPRTSQESVRSRGNASGGGGFPAAPPGRSNHGAGRALDFADSRARAWLRANAREFDLETLGGNFDMPHIQLRGGAGANMGAPPSEQERAEQRTINEQNRQAAIARGLLGGRGNQQAGVPMPRGRPSDAPQAEVAVPPADIPAALPPPTMPLAPDRPPADIPAPVAPLPAPFLTPPARGRADPVLLDRAVSNITTQALKGIGPQTTKEQAIAKGVAARVAMIQAGIPAAMAQPALLDLANKTAAAMGYSRSDYMGMVGSAIDKGIAEAMQGYAPAAPGPVQGPFGFQPDAPRGLAKGGHVKKDEPVVVGEEGPETFVPDTAGTVVPHMPQPGKGKNVDRWPKMPAVNYPGRYGGVEREYERQTREAQNPVPSLMDLIDSGRLPLNAANWHAMLNDPSLIALGRSRIEDRVNGGPEPAAMAEVPPDPTNPMAQALGYGSIKRRPMQIGRQSY